jgi:hypothetical protein
MAGLAAVVGDVAIVACAVAIAVGLTGVGDVGAVVAEIENTVGITVRGNALVVVEVEAVALCAHRDDILVGVTVEICGSNMNLHGAS